MPNESVGKTVTVAVSVCVVCSIFVSTAAVKLRPIQERNKALDMQKNILVAAGLIKEGEEADYAELFKQIEARVIDLDTGDYVEGISPKEFNPRKAAKDPDQSVRIPEDEDLAKIKRRAKYSLVYFVRRGGSIQRVILPVYGKGLWSTMYGLLALDTDLNTVASFSFYEHGETPGLGGEVDSKKWKEQWRGKEVFGPDWQPDIQVVKGTVDPNSPNADHQVDGLSGATLTARGVQNLLRFWLGPDGYGPFLEKLRADRQTTFRSLRPSGRTAAKQGPLNRRAISRPVPRTEIYHG
jgi:Na+-transporting NADH:ubiquinone oxidoreductase subunit C